jgi:hypothetical protein
VLYENLRQFVHSIVNQSVARARDRRRAMRHLVDGRTHRRRPILGDHPRDCGRRSDLAVEALHKNCSDRRRLYAIGKTIDGFSFQTCPTAHLSSVGERRKVVH